MGLAVLCSRPGRQMLQLLGYNLAHGGCCLQNQAAMPRNTTFQPFV